MAESARAARFRFLYRESEGTIGGREFATRSRQQPKRALVELPVITLPRGVSHLPQGVRFD